jgi:hypothetical protein
VATFVSDTFTDANATTLTAHTPDGGGAWVRTALSTGFAQINTNRCAGDGSEVIYRHNGTPASAEYDVQATLFVNTNASYWAITGRHIETGSASWYAAEYDQGAGNWSLIKRNNGVSTNLGTFAQTLTVGNSYVVKLSLRTAQKSVEIDGVTRITSADDAVTSAGNAGFYANANGSVTGYHFDAFTAVDPASGPRFILGTH